MFNRSALGNKNLNESFNDICRFGSPALALVESKSKQAKKGLISNDPEPTSKVLSRYICRDLKPKDLTEEKSTKEGIENKRSDFEKVKVKENKMFYLGVRNRKNNTPSFSKETGEDMAELKKTIECLKHEQDLLKSELNSQKNIISKMRDSNSFGEFFRSESRMRQILRVSPELDLNNVLSKVKILKDRGEDSFLAKNFEKTSNLPLISGCKSDRLYKFNISTRVKYSKDQPILKNFKFPKDIFIVKKQRN